MVELGMTVRQRMSYIRNSFDLFRRGRISYRDMQMRVLSQLRYLHPAVRRALMRRVHLLARRVPVRRFPRRRYPLRRPRIRRFPKYVFRRLPIRPPPRPVVRKPLPPMVQRRIMFMNRAMQMARRRRIPFRRFHAVVKSQIRYMPPHIRRGIARVMRRVSRKVISRRKVMARNVAVARRMMAFQRIAMRKAVAEKKIPPYVAKMLLRKQRMALVRKVALPMPIAFMIKKDVPVFIKRMVVRRGIPGTVTRAVSIPSVVVPVVRPKERLPPIEIPRVIYKPPLPVIVPKVVKITPPPFRPVKVRRYIVPSIISPKVIARAMKVARRKFLKFTEFSRRK